MSAAGSETTIRTSDLSPTITAFVAGLPAASRCADGSLRPVSGWHQYFSGGAGPFTDPTMVFRNEGCFSSGTALSEALLDLATGSILLQFTYPSSGGTPIAASAISDKVARAGDPLPAGDELAAVADDASDAGEPLRRNAQPFCAMSRAEALVQTGRAGGAAWRSAWRGAEL